jgi:hypothetical protein
MILTRKLVLVLCLVLLFSNHSKAQDLATINKPSTVNLTANSIDLINTNSTSNIDLNTGNLISINNWTGVLYTDNAGVGNCCIGGPNPAINQDTNTLRFSYGMMAAAQSIALTKVFEAIGTGIKVTGYNYSWQINNEGNTSGPLYANVSLIGKNGNVLESYNYDYNRYIPGFETFSGTQKFSVDYGAPSLQSLDVSFTGKDTRWWAGYYGPRVREINVSLNYAFDTSKPPASITLPTVVTNVDTITASIASSGLLATTEGLPQIVQQAAATGSLVNFDGTINTTQQTQQIQQSVQQVVQPSIRVTAEPQKENATKSSGPSSLAMSVVSKVQEAVKTVEKEAVAAVAMQTANDVKNADQQTMSAIAMVSAQTTQTSQQSSQNVIGLQLPQQQQQSNITITQIRSNEPQVLQSAQVQQAITDVSLYNLAPVTSSKSNPGISLIAQTLPQQEVPAYILPTPQFQTTQFEINQQIFISQEISTVTINTTLRGNPLSDLIENKPTLESMVQEQKTEELKRSITTNQLETGITLTAMAIVPPNYALYGISLADTKFYEPKPIYQNQKVVDNVRVLRGLGSDQKHQQMVQDQYR